MNFGNDKVDVDVNISISGSLTAKQEKALSLELRILKNRIAALALSEAMTILNRVLQD